jgi:hypothetical protein
VIGVQRRPNVVKLSPRGQPYFNEIKLAEALKAGDVCRLLEKICAGLDDDLRIAASLAMVGRALDWHPGYSQSDTVGLQTPRATRGEDSLHGRSVSFELRPECQQTFMSETQQTSRA